MGDLEREMRDLHAEIAHLRAEKQAVVARINAAEGDSLAVDAVILELQ